MNIKGGKDINELAAHIDVLPTLTALCNIDLPNLKIDGSDMSSVILGDKKRLTENM